MHGLKLNKKYLVLDESFARYFIVTGGRGSGKSFAVNSVLLLLTYQAGHTILFTRYTLRAASISIIPEFIALEEFTLKVVGDVYFDPRTITRDDYRNLVFSRMDSLYGTSRFERSYSLSQIVNEINSVSEGSRTDVVNLRLEVQTPMTVSGGSVKIKYYGNHMKPNTLRTTEPTSAHPDLVSEIDAPDGLISIRTSGGVLANGKQILEAYYSDNGFVSVVNSNVGYWTPNASQCEVRIKPKIFADGTFNISAEPKDDEGSQQYSASTNQYSKLGTEFTFRITG